MNLRWRLDFTAQLHPSQQCSVGTTVGTDGTVFTLLVHACTNDMNLCWAKVSSHAFIQGLYLSSGSRQKRQTRSYIGGLGHYKLLPLACEYKYARIYWFPFQRWSNKMTWLDTQRWKQVGPIKLNYRYLYDSNMDLKILIILMCLHGDDMPGVLAGRHFFSNVINESCHALQRNIIINYNRISGQYNINRLIKSVLLYMREYIIIAL